MTIICKKNKNGINISNIRSTQVLQSQLPSSAYINNLVSISSKKIEVIIRAFQNYRAKLRNFPIKKYLKYLYTVMRLISLFIGINLYLVIQPKKRKQLFGGFIVIAGSIIVRAKRLINNITIVKTKLTKNCWEKSFSQLFLLGGGLFSRFRNILFPCMLFLAFQSLIIVREFSLYLFHKSF